MSQPFRPSSEGAAPSLHPSMLPTFGVPRPPIMYSTTQVAYQFSPSPQQFVPASVVYSSQLPSSQSGISVTATPVIPAMYSTVPGVQRFDMHQLPLGTRPAGVQRIPAVDPSKLIEEQKKLEKERNFQLQQQRLKQFTVAGKKGSINADNLIDSMFGKPPVRKDTQKFDKAEGQNQGAGGTGHMFDIATSQPVSITASFPEHRQSSDLKVVNSSRVDFDQKPAKDSKGLENMMMECSDFSRPQKARTFHKPTVRELPPSSQQGVTFAPSDKARDWTNVQGLDRIFILPKARFPAWCRKDHVLPLYHQIEALVTSEGNHPPDTNLLYPILISSGLSREVLGHIWELVNQTSPGHLIPEEMYAALALVAVAQSGHPIKSTDILHSLPKCPLPILHSSSQPSPPVSSDPSVRSENTDPCVAPAVSSSVSSIVRPTRPTNITIAGVADPLPDAVTVGSSHPESNVSAWAPFKSSDVGTPQSADDDFDDFQSATPTAVGAHSIIAPSTGPVSNTLGSDDDDEFGDFKQATCVAAPSSGFSSSQKEAPFSTAATSEKKHPDFVKDHDLMSPEEDKYSVFRLLQEKEKSDWTVAGSADSNDQQSIDTTNSNVLFSTSDSSVEEKENILPKIFNNSVYTSQGLTDSKHGSEESNVSAPTTLLGSEHNEEDDFGDFLHADVASSKVPKIAFQTPGAFQCDFANFADFNRIGIAGDAPSNSPSWVSSAFPVTSSNSGNLASPDDEFGEFASCHSVHPKSEISQDFIFHHLKDNISLAESQSVSSLELGVIDGGGHSGESKSSLSRQGSVPSLDLKGVCLEGTDNEDGFGEMQNAVAPVSSKTPSPSSDTTKPAEEKSPSILPGFPFHASTVPLADKYSVIRSEHTKEEDTHISDWTRCIQRCHGILQDATKIFNQMSCSSVCNEVLNSEEGANYVKDVLEVYKVACRIAVASKAAGKQTDKLRHIIDEVDQAWNTLAVFLTGSTLLPDDFSLDFSKGVLRADPENNYNACGLCLINVDSHSKSFNRTEESHKLSYGGRQYHSTCANLWVNFVDPLLPALTLPQLL